MAGSCSREARVTPRVADAGWWTMDADGTHAALLMPVTPTDDEP